jgi:hypothetical protein
MEEILLTGSDYVKFSRAVYQNSRLSELSCWKQPLIFYPNSVVLQQRMGGPCALFAILQSSIIYECLQSGREVQPYAFLYETALNLVFRLCKLYIFCVDFSDSQQLCRFVVTRSRATALRFLRRNWLMWDPWACLKFVMALIFASVDLTALKVPDKPYIGADKWAVMGLVWMVFNGSDSDEAILQVMTNGKKALLETRIGVRVLNEKHPPDEEPFLNPEAKVFICLDGEHFLVTELLERGKVRIWDCESGPGPTIL